MGIRFEQVIMDGYFGYSSLRIRQKSPDLLISREIQKLKSPNESSDKDQMLLAVDGNGCHLSSGCHAFITGLGFDFRFPSFFHSGAIHRSGGRFVKPAPGSARPARIVRLDGSPAAPYPRVRKKRG